MSRSHAKIIRAAIVPAIAAALTVGGVAAAQGTSETGSRSAGTPGPHHRHPQGPPPMGLPIKGLTYAEIHVEHEGEAKVIALEQGKVQSVGESSIELRENDGSEVSIPIGQQTKVLGKPGSKASTEELKGKLVLVSGPSGGTAKMIVIEPKHPGRGAGPHGAGGRGAGPGPAGRLGAGGKGARPGAKGARSGRPHARSGHPHRKGRGG